MSKRISVARFVCLNCNTEYETEAEAGECIKNHPFPKKLWINTMTLARENIDQYLKRVATDVLGFSEIRYRSDEGCPVERFIESFSMDFLVEVDSYGDVKILEAYPLGGLGLGAKYELKVIPKWE